MIDDETGIFILELEMGGHIACGRKIYYKLDSDMEGSTRHKAREYMVALGKSFRDE